MKTNENTMIAILDISAAIYFSINSYHTNSSRTEIAKSGLEECPKSLGIPNTIWVKSCKEHLETTKRLEKEG